MGREIISHSSRKNRDEHESGDQSGTVASCRLFRGECWLRLLEFLRQRGVAQRFSVEVDQMEPDTVLDLAFAEVAQP